MQTPGFTDEALTQQYTTAVDALWEIARAAFFLGRLGEARHLLSTSLQLLEAREAKPQHRLKLLLLQGQIFVVDHLLTRGGDSDPLFATIQHAQQIAEEAQDQQGIADALGLLGEAHYFTTVMALLKSGASPDSPQDEGKYAEALAFQQQALKLREALRDTRGISESYFQIGAIHERWRQFDQAQTYYAQARRIADQYGHAFEKTEPARHVALDALRKGNLDQALVLALQTVELREAVGFKPYLPLDHLLVRDIYEALGDTANAQLQLQKASAIAEEIGSPALVGSVPVRRYLQETQQEQA